MPILSRLHKKVSETAVPEVDSLAEWADSVINEKLDMDDKKPAKKQEKDADSKPKVAGSGPGPLDRIKVDAEKKRTGKLAKFFGVQEGDVIPFKKKKHDDDDDSWIPSIEDFEQEEAIRNRNREYQKRKRTPANDVNEMDKSPEANPYSGQGHRKGDDHAGKPQHTAKIIAAKQAVKMARKALDKAFKGDVDENFISMAPQAVAEEEVEEGLDANQKRVGQLGPTEKVKNNNIGKLVGASESTEIDPALARIMEMARFKR
jgi:hypothetical protein